MIYIGKTRVCRRSAPALPQLPASTRISRSLSVARNARRPIPPQRPALPRLPAKTRVSRSRSQRSTAHPAAALPRSRSFQPQAAFLAPFRSLATLTACAAAQGFGAPEGSACPVGTWAEGPKRSEGGERNERWARPAPSATIERPGVCPKPRQARREACALWALGPKAQSDPQRGSETMRATVRECA